MVKIKEWLEGIFYYFILAIPHLVSIQVGYCLATEAYGEAIIGIIFIIVWKYIETHPIRML